MRHLRSTPRWLVVVWSAGALLLLLRRPVPAQAPTPALPLGISSTLYEISVPGGGVRPRADLVALGDKLFNDKRLSIDDSISCATCHDPQKGFVDHKALSEGVGRKEHPTQRNSPTVLNAMFNATQFWDGRAASLEEQAKLPILNPIEMGQKSPEDVVAKLRGIPEYAQAFQRGFGRDVNYEDVAAAIAEFERTQLAGDAPFDRFLNGDAGAISEAAQRGWVLFNGKGRCISCHAFNLTNHLFSDQKFHNIGIAAHKTDFIGLARKATAIVRSGDLKQIDELAIESSLSELGRFLVTKQSNDIGAFKTPTLRNIAITGPYMHDGSLATLWDVMDHYNKGGITNPNLDGGMLRLGLSEAQIDDMVAFLDSLTSDNFAAFGKQEMARMTALKAKRPERDNEIALGSKGDMGDLAPEPDLKNPAEIGFLRIVPAAAAKPQSAAAKPQSGGANAKGRQKH